MIKIQKQQDENIRKLLSLVVGGNNPHHNPLLPKEALAQYIKVVAQRDELLRLCVDLLDNRNKIDVTE